jgi:fructokinase
MIDPNIRPGFIAGKEAEYRARIERMIARADIVKLSDEDLHWLEGPGDLTALARGILAKGPKVVFITEGARGARAVTATQDRFVAARRSRSSIPWARATRSTRACWPRCIRRGR